MQIPKITNYNNQNFGNKNTKKEKIVSNATTFAAPTIVMPSAFLLVDNFTKRKEYKKEINTVLEEFNQAVNIDINNHAEKVRSWGEEVTDIDLEVYKGIYEKKHARTYRPKVDLLKNTRKSYLKKWLSITTGIGISIGTIALAIKNMSKKQQQQGTTPKTSTTITQTKIPQSYQAFQKPSFSQISFTGVIGEIADEIDSTTRESYTRYVNGENPSPYELSEAKRIASYRLKDWPKGLDNVMLFMYGIPHGNPVYSAPTSDREYHKILIDQDYYVPSKPPKYYRNYDKLFNTERWQEFQKWPEYIEKALKNERMQTLVEKEKILQYAQEKKEQEILAQRNIASACFKYKMNQEFLTDFNSNDENTKVKNAIMIQGGTKQERIENIKWLIGKAQNARFIHLKEENDTNQNLLDRVLTAIEEAQENYEKDKHRTILWVENFDKLLLETPENEEIIGDIKALLSEASSEYKTTIVFETNIDTKRMNPIALQEHRTKKFHIDKDSSLELLKKLEADYVRSHIKKMKNSDGYEFYYKPFHEEKVELYLGKFGYYPEVLWVQSQDAEVISAVINNFSTIKTIPKFKRIEKLHFPKPLQIKDFDSSKLYYTYELTKEGQPIYEYRL